MSRNADKNLKLWTWIILLVLLQSCGTSPFATGSPTPAVESAVAVIDELSTATPAFSGTKTPTTTVFIAPTATRTIRPSITPTVFPTRYIPEAEIKAYWQTIVMTNGGCDLPCFLGLHPGKSDWEDVEKLFSPVEAVSKYKLEPSDYPSWHELRGICISECGFYELQLDLYEEAGIFQSISARTEGIGHEPEVAKALDAYRLENVFTKYGEPSRVWLRLEPFPNHRDAEPVYSLNVFYDNQGILLDYWGYGVAILGPEKSVARVCPSFEKLIAFTLFLQSEDDPTPLEDRTVGTEADLQVELPGLDLRHRPIENTTDLSISDFYNRLKTPGACFDSPTGIWR